MTACYDVFISKGFNSLFLMTFGGIIVKNNSDFSSAWYTHLDQLNGFRSVLIRHHATWVFSFVFILAYGSEKFAPCNGRTYLSTVTISLSIKQCRGFSIWTGTIKGRKFASQSRKVTVLSGGFRCRKNCISCF